MGSEPSTTVGALILIASMPNTLNLCNSFGGDPKKEVMIGYILFVSLDIVDKR